MNPLPYLIWSPAYDILAFYFFCTVCIGVIFWVNRNAPYLDENDNDVKPDQEAA